MPLTGTISVACQIMTCWQVTSKIRSARSLTCYLPTSQMTIPSTLHATDTASSITAIQLRAHLITTEEERVNKDIAARITPQEMIAFKTQTRTGLTLDTKSLVSSRYLSTKPRKGAKVGKLQELRAYHSLQAVSIKTYILPKVRVSTTSLALNVDQ